MSQNDTLLKSGILLILCYRFPKRTAPLIDQEQIREAAVSILDAEHLCISLRGVKKPGARMVTSAYRGEFETDAGLRDDFRSMARND